MRKKLGEIIPGDIYDVASRNIKKYRKAAGLSSEKLAERVGISPEYLRRIEAPMYKGGFSIQVVYDISLAPLSLILALLNTSVRVFYTLSWLYQ